MARQVPQVLNENVSGNDMLRAHHEIGRLANSVDRTAERLMVSWSG